MEGDRQQDVALASIVTRGFQFDWPAVLRNIGRSDPLDSIESALLDETAVPEWRDTLRAIAVNGQMIATFVQRKHEENAGLRTSRTFAFAEQPQLFTPTGALDHWQRILGFDDATLRNLLAAAGAIDDEAQTMSADVVRGLMSRLGDLYAETIGAGLSFRDFEKRALEIMPGASRHLLETHYRTKLTQVYGGSRFTQIRARANVFPFIQFMAIRDPRTTWWICLPMGTAGPNGRGYVAATDDGVWIIWTPPNHWQCRSDLSPIGYREAQRMGILAKDGVTKIARVGKNPARPWGDPPQWAEHPKTGALRRVEPQEGFAA